MFPFVFFQAAFDTLPMTIVKVIVMTIGEVDYNSMLVDNLEAKNPDTGAHLVPYRESSFIFMCIFVFAMPIVLTNLLVSNILGCESFLYRALLKLWGGRKSSSPHPYMG